jgi:hypothetical protein
LNAITTAEELRSLTLDSSPALAILLLRAGDRRGSRASDERQRDALELPRVELDPLLDRRGLSIAREGAARSLSLTARPTS